MIVEVENWKDLGVYSEVEDNGKVVLAQGGLLQKSKKTERKW